MTTDGIPIQLQPRRMRSQRRRRHTLVDWNVQLRHRPRNEVDRPVENRHLTHSAVHVQVATCTSDNCPPQQSNHTLRRCTSTVLTATELVNGKWLNSAPNGIDIL